MSTRIHGLDTLRAAAICLVFMYHYMVFVSHAPTFGVLSTVGWVGVDLFFVLSGYLIGRQLFAGLARGERLSLGAFYARRALRTWPAFWCVLAAYFLFPAAMGGKPPPPLWRFLTFTQNLGLHAGTAFSHAWSLCIEEQFYLVLPLAAGLAPALGRHARRWQAWLGLAGLLGLGILSRGWLWQDVGRESLGRVGDYYPRIYYSTLCRLDEFLPGLAVALLQSGYPRLWARLMAPGQAVLLAGLLATGAVLYGVAQYYYVEDYGYGFFMTTFGYSAIAMAFALLVVAALSPVSWLHRARVPGATRLARWSYSIYLTHKAVGHVVADYAAAHGVSPEATLAGVTLLSVGVGAALFHAVEAPFMRLRERWVPRLFGSRPEIGQPPTPRSDDDTPRTPGQGTSSTLPVTFRSIMSRSARGASASG